MFIQAWYFRFNLGEECQWAGRTCLFKSDILFNLGEEWVWAGRSRGACFSSVIFYYGSLFNLGEEWVWAGRSRGACFSSVIFYYGSLFNLGEEWVSAGRSRGACLFKCDILLWNFVLFGWGVCVSREVKKGMFIQVWFCFVWVRSMSLCVSREVKRGMFIQGQVWLVFYYQLWNFVCLLMNLLWVKSDYCNYPSTSLVTGQCSLLNWPVSVREDWSNLDWQLTIVNCASSSSVTLIRHYKKYNADVCISYYHRCYAFLYK